MAIDKTYQILLKKLVDGTITDKERWALDKASMNDPFLADALEGYYNNKSDKDALNIPLSRLTKPKSKTIPLWKPLSVAASLALMFGISFWMMQGEDNQISVAHKSSEVEVIDEAKELESEVNLVIENNEVRDLQKEKSTASIPETNRPITQTQIKEELTAQPVKERASSVKEVAEAKSSPASDLNVVQSDIVPDQEEEIIATNDQDALHMPTSNKTVARAKRIMNEDLADIESGPLLVRGMVKDIHGVPIKNAYVITDKNKDSTLTLADGSFVLSVTDMDQKAEAQYAGFASPAKYLEPELVFSLDKVQSSFSEPPMLLQETMSEEELKDEYEKIIDTTLRNPWNICKSDSQQHRKIQMRIHIDEQGELNQMDYLTNVDESCRMEIEDLIRQAVFDRKFNGNKAVTIYYTLRF